ncbi:ABC transporter permease [Edaphobacter sp. 12200R-103]|uniref:ABC transporter permease n=1 Tax=Edaphobacter sp. 12200R-103 TaxID=2703788 RepID=UPI00138DB945|nr:ABC transporter permease [Edaphobacter sp. 12200R-103]QHS52027.1 ABC transporter permease [Edaphobacter sp. 12200R-103]
MTSFVQDVRFALRQLKKTPAFTVTVLLTLALGIGANAAIFTLINSVLLRNLPVADPAMLVRVGDDPNACCVGSGWANDGDYSLFPTEAYEEMKKNAPEFEELAAIQAGFSFRPVTVRRDGPDALPKSVMGEYVSGNYFRTFGLRPYAGRLFNDADNMKGAPMTAVISYAAWQRDFSGDPRVIGGTFWVNTKPVTVVGVAPKGFYGDRLLTTPPDYYLPIETMPEIMGVSYVHDPNTNWLYIVGRVKPGTAMGPLQEKLGATMRQALLKTRINVTTGEGKNKFARTHVTLTPGGAGIQRMQQQYGEHLHLLMWIAGLVLLVACANIANLLLVRGMARKTEMSVRSAMGAGRSRLVRQLLTESVLLSGMGGLLGLAVAYGGTRMLLALVFPGAQDVPIDANPAGEVIAFAFGLSLLTGVLFGVAPAWLASRAQPADVLRSGVRTTASGATKLQKALVILQAGLSFVLLVGAGLFAQSLRKLESTDMKLDSRNRYIVHINPQAAGYKQTQLEGLYREIENRFHMLPGVVKVGITSYTPMEDNNNGWGWKVQGMPNVSHGASFLRVNSEYFDSVGTKVLMGRGVGIGDTSTAPPVAVVNQAFAKKFFGDANPIGRRIGSDDPGEFEIIGVVEDTVYQSVRWTDHLMVFVPSMQRPSDYGPIEKDLDLYAGAIVLQTDRPMNEMETIVRKTLAGINPNLTVVKFQTFDQQIADQFTEERMLSRLTMLFGGLALLLAAIGLYGVTAYTVVRRTQEIGIRMALGADRSGVVAMILRGAMAQALVGLAIGIPVALLCVRFVKSQLYGVTKVDAGVLVAALAVLGLAAAVAGLIPAKRAASIEPMEALRME